MLENTLRETIPKLTKRTVEACQSEFNLDGSYMGQPGLVLGNPGVGKSAMFQSACMILSAVMGVQWQLVDIRALLYDPVELKGMQGLPNDDSDFTRVFNPDWARGLDPNGHYIILFEEMTKCLQSTSNALLQIILDRRIANFPFGKWWVPMATGNLATSRAGDLPIPATIRDRFWIVIAEHSTSAWLKWAQDNNLHPAVTTFFKLNPEYLDGWDPETDPLAFSTGRSAFALSQSCKTAENPGDWGIPFLGSEAGMMFDNHVTMLETLPDPLLIFKDPANAPVMDNIGTAFHLASSLSYFVDKETMQALCIYAERCAHEVGMTMVTEAARRHPEVMETSGYINYICKHDPQQS